jgi:hypothetical protein
MKTLLLASLVLLSGCVAVYRPAINACGPDDPVLSVISVERKAK